MVGHHQPANETAFRWRADDGPFIAVIWSLYPPSTKKKVIKFGPTLTKLSGSAHESDVYGVFVRTGMHRLV